MKNVHIPTQVIEYSQNFLQADQPIRLQYSNQIELYVYRNKHVFDGGWFGTVYAFHKPLHDLLSINCPKPGYIV
jgi:hypothetical protein